MKETILITGGTGFLGKRLACALKDKYTVVLAARNNMQNAAAQKSTGCHVTPMDVTNIESVRDAVNECRPDTIIHAAASKFVDLAENEPMECIDVNVLGSQNVARVAVDKQVRTVIGISTDKTAPPVGNLYGLTKALMERMYCSMNGKSETRFTCVRFGNIAWSSGSVFPIWQQMIDATGEIGTTGPEMRRFFLHVDEAVKIVLTAMDNIERLQGKVLVRHMKAAQIGDILNLWIEHKGGRWQKIQGRPGDRDDEYLLGETELAYAEEAEFGGLLHYIISFNEKTSLPARQVLSSANAERLSEQEILNLINSAPEDDRPCQD